MEPGVIIATHNFKRNLFLNSYIEREKNLTLICFLLPLKRERKKMSEKIAAYFLCLVTPGLPACYLLIPLLSFTRTMLPKEKDIILIL